MWDCNYQRSSISKLLFFLKERRLLWRMYTEEGRPAVNLSPPLLQKCIETWKKYLLWKMLGPAEPSRWWYVHLGRAALLLVVVLLLFILFYRRRQRRN